MQKQTSIEKALEQIQDDMTIMVGGFLGVGTPQALVDACIKKQLNNITLICNDTAFPEVGVGKWIVNRMVKKAIVSHIGTNPETGKQMMANETEVTLVPQGSLAEKIRCGGMGLGGVLTKTGVGTLVEEGKQNIVVENETYILETPLHADIALIYVDVADETGNLMYHGSTKNFNPLMAAAADMVIVEAKQIVPVGTLSPDHVAVPHILVDAIVKGD